MKKKLIEILDNKLFDRGELIFPSATLLDEIADEIITLVDEYYSLMEEPPTAKPSLAPLLHNLQTFSGKTSCFNKSCKTCFPHEKACMCDDCVPPTDEVEWKEM